MPAPIAHASVALFGVPALGAPPAGEPRWRAIGLTLLVLFACVAPDMDIPVGWIAIGEPFTHHGHYSHSLLLAPAFGVLFLCAAKVLRPSLPTGRAWAIGTALYALHVVMDALVVGTRGVGLLWPLIPERMSSPVGIFFGLKYSEPGRWDLHLLTIANECAFAAVLWWIATQRRKKRARTGLAQTSDPSRPERTAPRAHA